MFCGDIKVTFIVIHKCQCSTSLSYILHPRFMIHYQNSEHLTRGLTNPYCHKTIDNGEKPFHHRVPHEKSLVFYIFFLTSCIRIFICSIVLCHSKLEQIHWFNELIPLIPIYQINTHCKIIYTY